MQNTLLMINTKTKSCHLKLVKVGPQEFDDIDQFLLEDEPEDMASGPESFDEDSAEDLE